MLNARRTYGIGRHSRSGYTPLLVPGLLAFLLIGAGEIIALIIAETAEFLFGRALADNDGDSLPLAVSDQFDRHFATDRQIRDDIGQGIVRRHILAIQDRQSVVEGKSVSVRLDLGGRR